MTDWFPSATVAAFASDPRLMQAPTSAGPITVSCTVSTEVVPAVSLPWLTRISATVLNTSGGTMWVSADGQPAAVGRGIPIPSQGGRIWAFPFTGTPPVPAINAIMEDLEGTASVEYVQ